MTAYLAFDTAPQPGDLSLRLDAASRAAVTGASSAACEVRVP